MEALIPIIALGGLVMSLGDKRTGASKDKDKGSAKKTVETYQNMNRVKDRPTAALSTYPVQKISPEDTLSAYVRPNDATAQYFDQNKYFTEDIRGKDVGNNIHQVHSLTGTKLDESNFVHNNMTPFYSGKSTHQTMIGHRSDSVMDNMVGGGSQVHNKEERAPLFKPENNIQWSHGQPNMNEFYQSRSNPGVSRNNVKPFESEMVAPAINAGYNSAGKGGFNAGMEARETYMPKSVDALRVATNPKMEYSLANHQGPANSSIKNVGVMGKMEQHKPDTFFTQSEDRWLKTTGDEKAQMGRPTQEIHNTSRMQSQSYSGIAAPGDRNANYLPGEYEASTRQSLPSHPITNVKGTDAGLNVTAIQKSYNTYTNNRDINNKAPQTFGSGFSTAIGAVIAPITDMLNPTKKQETINNMRVYGNAASSVQSLPVTNPNDTAPVTVKETTLYSPNTFIQNQNSDGYLVAQHQAIPNQRDTTNQGTFTGASTTYGNANYGAAYNQTNNETKEKLVVSRPNHGSTQMFNTTMNVNIARNDGDRNNNRLWAPTNMPAQTMSKETYGRMSEPQNYNQNVAIDRMAPDLLTAFKTNPYTHSLTDAVPRER